MANEKYESVIGLEVHAQLSTAGKIFCGCANQFGAEPNSATCPVCLGLPGALPVLNRKAVEYVLRLILSVNGKFNLVSEFARKNYFYPDLPKGYQITQYDRPIGEGGALDIELEGVSGYIPLKRIHLEEDAGKLLHPEDDTDYTLVDYNRCGTPLAEIVTEPEIHSPKEAHLYLLKLKQLLRYLEICSGDMEKGALRCDANVSVRRKGRMEMGVKTEVKNLNSFKAVEKALEYEINRQTGLIEKGESVRHETLLWDEAKQECRVMRSKEESADYRYFPEPDLPLLALDD
ncbi:MAG: Asp-tRNA(Asn)/Glu-tRNA(Gln) amidotransferase subunit GatB, partial [candidate division Zixibacteria bacterium]|nr:Asp-tRNA(Asn)/Glu-tRNA(Gln) amidotransferase subunit GatB [candidate division Zixibacteria bacterium]